MSDSISREVVIGAVKRLSLGETDATRLAMRIGDYLKRVPSAQPEIIRCNSCKHWAQTIGEMRGFGLGTCDFHNAEYVTCNGFCHWAERREQNG